MEAEGDLVWERLLSTSGAPKRASEVDDEALREAHRDGRVIRVRQFGDGMGTDAVSMRFLALDERPTRAFVVIGPESYADFVFATAVTLSDHERSVLADPYANSWERWETIHRLPNPAR